VIGLAAADAGYGSAYSFGGAGEAYGFLGDIGSSGGGIAPFGADGFVGRYGGGAPAWVKRIVGPGEDKLVDPALQAGNLYAIGWFEGQSSFDGIAMSSSSGSRDILLARMSPSTGQIDVTRVLGSPGRDEASSSRRSRSPSTARR
jgi:hypothetical protein